jgi:hypothetical protein
MSERKHVLAHRVELEAAAMRFVFVEQQLALLQRPVSYTEGRNRVEGLQVDHLKPV